MSDDHWISKKKIKATKSVKTKGRSPTAKGYSEGIESGFASANTQAIPRANYTGKKNISNLFKSKEYKTGFNKGRVEAVKMIKKEIKTVRQNMGLQPQVDLVKAYTNRKYK
tara:strand:- start:163 stop:495 length:333 start_codon:yes stop_codon:yes gene_type:complete